MPKIVFSLFTLHLIFLAYFNNFYVAGIPFRSALILLSGALVAFHQKDVFSELKLVSKIYLLLMGYGLMVSLVSQVELGKIVNGELKLLQSLPGDPLRLLSGAQLWLQATGLYLYYCGFTFCSRGGISGAGC